MEDNYQSEFVKDRRSRLRRHMLYVMGECCQICGYNRCSSALEFHHLDPTTKERNLSKNWPYSWERFKEELKKCILLCSNCHREVHLGIIDQSNLKASFDKEKAKKVSEIIAETKQGAHYYCHRCGQETGKRTAYYCKKCAEIMGEKTEKPSRNELKQDIRKNNFLTLSRKYQVSDHAIRKWCEAEGLPAHKKEIDAYTDEEWALI